MVDNAANTKNEITFFILFQSCAPQFPDRSDNKKGVGTISALSSLTGSRIAPAWIKQ